jgi:hypothetical protein
MKQLISRSNTQYGNAQTNYVDALRNAGMGAAKSGRDYLALEQPRLQSGINTKFADALASLNTNRTSAEGDIMGTFQKALENAAEIKTKAETDYPQTKTMPSTEIANPVGEGVDMGAVAGKVDAETPEQRRKRIEEELAGFAGRFGQGFLTR